MRCLHLQIRNRTKQSPRADRCRHPGCSSCEVNTGGTGGSGLALGYVVTVMDVTKEHIVDCSQRDARGLYDYYYGYSSLRKQTVIPDGDQISFHTPNAAGVLDRSQKVRVI